MSRYSTASGGLPRVPFIQSRGERLAIDLAVDAPAGPPAEANRPDGLTYEALDAALRPWLEGADLADLSRDDIAFLAEESGLAAADIDRLVLAARAARFSGLPGAAFHAALLASARWEHSALGDGWARFLADQAVDPEHSTRFRFLALAAVLVQFEQAPLNALLERLERQEFFGPLDLALWDRPRRARRRGAKGRTRIGRSNQRNALPKSPLLQVYLPLFFSLALRLCVLRKISFFLMYILLRPVAPPGRL